MEPAEEDTVISHGPTAYSKGLTADNNTGAWAHRVSIKKMSPAPGIKFSRGPGQRVERHFYFDGTLILKIVAIKRLMGKF
jgi:hypothetical protein